MITVLIADDTTLIRQLLVQQLSRETGVRVVAEAEDGRQAVELCLSHSPDIVLMDLKMPRMNGIEAMERIKALRPKTRVILLSAYEDLISLGHLSGAAECLDKSCTTQELLAAIRRVAASDQEEFPPPESDLIGAVERLSVRAALTEREKTVLLQLVTTDQTSGQIASVLSLAMSHPITEAAVRHTIERIMNKLAIEPRTRASLVKFVMEQCRGDMVLGESDDGSPAPERIGTPPCLAR